MASDPYLEFPNKPDLTLYVGKKVTEIVRPENALPWQWAIKLENGVLIVNKDRRETFVPSGIVGYSISTISFSVRDTTIHFFKAESEMMKWSLNPTQYAVHDPKHGGEVYPQWPQELEEAGIPSHPEEPVSDKPVDPEAWEQHRQGEIRDRQVRAAEAQREWIREDDGA